MDETLFAAVDDGYVEFLGTQADAEEFARTSSSYLRVVPAPDHVLVGDRLDLQTLELANLVPETITVTADQFAELEALLDAEPQASPKLQALLQRPSVFDEEKS